MPTTLPPNFRAWEDLTEEEQRERIRLASNGRTVWSLRRRITAALEADRLSDEARWELADLLVDGIDGPSL